MLHGVTELSDVAGPGMAAEGFEGRHGEGLAGGRLSEKMKGEEIDVLRPVPEVRYSNHDDVKAEVEVFPELAGLHEGLEGPVSGGEDADVGVNGLAAADAFEGSFLEETEELLLEGRGQVADFVEEDRAALGPFEVTEVAFGRSGEGSALVSVQLALGKGLGQPRAIDGDERSGSPVAVPVNGSGGEFLAGSAAAFDQDGEVRLADRADLLEDLLHERVRSQERVRSGEGAFGVACGNRDTADPAGGERPVHEPADLVEVDRLGQVFECPTLDGLDGRVHVPMGGDDHHRRGAVPGADFR